MFHSKALLFVVSLTTCLVGAAGPTSTGTIRLTSACGDTGFAGTYTEGSTTVHFEACPVSGSARAKFWKPDGSLIVEFREENGVGIHWIAGIRLSEDTTDEQRQKMDAIMAWPETAIAHRVGPALLRMGFDLRAEPVMALARALMAFEATPHQEGSSNGARNK